MGYSGIKIKERIFSTAPLGAKNKEVLMR